MENDYDAELIDRMLSGISDIRTSTQKLIEDRVTNRLHCTPIRTNYSIFSDLESDFLAHLCEMDFITGKLDEDYFLPEEENYVERVAMGQ